MGREFLHVFEDWADEYDQTVLGKDEEYKEVFKDYERILDDVVKASSGHVLEFGAGTGNLTAKLLRKGHFVTAVEPSLSMAQIAKSKLKNKKLSFIEGDFLQFPKVEKIDTIVSTYAFHHLTDNEKREAVKEYGKLLPIGGKIVFADTMYENEAAFNQAILDAEKACFFRLAKDLRTEYYPTIPNLEIIFQESGYSVTFQRCNQFVWILEAIKI